MGHVTWTMERRLGWRLPSSRPTVWPYGESGIRRYRLDSIGAVSGRAAFKPYRLGQPSVAGARFGRLLQGTYPFGGGVGKLYFPGAKRDPVIL